MQARQIIDLGATYDVFDPNDNKQHLFSLQRKGIRSTFVRDKWLVLDSAGNQIAQLEEEGSIALLRRYIGFIPYVGAVADIVFFWQVQRYTLHHGTEQQPGPLAGEVFRRKNPFVVKFDTDTSKAESPISPSVMIALGTILSIIEAAKN